VRLPRPRHATVVAYLALFAATSGTAVAATALKNGDSLIARHSLSGNRLHTNTVTGAQVRESSLGTVPRAVSAATAATAATAHALVPMTWHPFTLLNGWKSYVTIHPPAWAVDAQGTVHLRGSLDRPSGASDVFADVPSAIATPTTIYVTADMVDATTGRIDIVPGFGFEVQESDNDLDATAFTSLDGITYSLK